MEHRKDKTYVTLPATKAGLEILWKSGILALVGPSGSGKTKCALDILSMLLDEGFKMVKLTDIKLWNNNVSANESCCVWFDDLLERKTDNFVDMNRSIFHTITACTRTGSVKVVMTIRADILFKHSTIPSWLVPNECVMDLDSNQYQLTRELKINILKCHLKASRFSEARKIKESTIDDIVQSRPLLGFPLCCHLFASVESNFEKGSVFFSSPCKELINSVSKLKTSQKRTYLALAYATLKNQVIDCSDIDEDLVKKLSRTLHLKRISFKSTLQEAVKGSTYFRRESYDIYTIKHLSLYKAVIVSLSEVSDELKLTVLKTVHHSILVETLRPVENFDKDLDYSIVAPKSLFNDIAIYVTEKLEQGYTTLLMCELWNSMPFISEVKKVQGDQWSMFCEKYFRHGCRYGNLALTQEMLISVSPTTRGYESIFDGLKEACVKGNIAIARIIFESPASSRISDDQLIQLSNIVWRNYDMCIYLIEKISKRSVGETQCETLLTHLARTGEDSLKLVEEAIRMININNQSIICNTATIAGRRGGLHLVKWFLKRYAEYEKQILHCVLLGVCKGGDIDMIQWLIENYENAVKENVLEYLVQSETPGIVRRFLDYDSQLSKLELGDLLNKHCAKGQSLIVKVIIDTCDRFSYSDIQNAIETAYRHGQHDVLNIIGDTFSFSHDERVAFLKDIQTSRGGIKTPWSSNPFTPGSYANIPSVNISTPGIHSMKHPETTIKRLLKKAYNETDEIDRAIKLNKICEMSGNISSNDISLCREILDSSPKISFCFLIENAIRACKHQNYEVFKILYEYDETLPFKIIEKHGKQQIDVDTIQCINRTKQFRGQTSLSLFLDHTVKNGRDLEDFLYSVHEYCQFNVDDYTEALDYILTNATNLSDVMMESAKKHIHMDELLTSACRQNNPKLVSFLLRQPDYSDISLSHPAFQIFIEDDNTNILESFNEHIKSIDTTALFMKCCEHSATSCVDMLINNKDSCKDLQTHIVDVLKSLWSNNLIHVIEDILTGSTYVKVSKADVMPVLLEACCKGHRSIIQKIKETYKFSGGEIVNAIKCACRNKDNGNLVQCLMVGMKFTEPQLGTIVKHLVKSQFYHYAAIIVNTKKVDWYKLLDVPLPTEPTEPFTSFVRQVIVLSDPLKYMFISKVMEKFPDLDISKHAVDMFNDIRNLAYYTTETIYCLRHLLNGYPQFFNSQVIMASIDDAEERRNKLRYFAVLNEYYVRKYNANEMTPYATKIFLNRCASGTFDIHQHEDELLELIVKLVHLPDDTVITCVNNYIKHKYKYSAPQPWTDTRLPTAHTLLEVMKRNLRSMVRLICSKWE